MKSHIAAFLCGIVVALAALSPSPGVSSSDPAAEGTQYYDMDTMHVQFQDKACGLRTIAIQYKIEYGDVQKTPVITAYKPKIQAILFDALSDYLAKSQNTSPKRLHKVMVNAVQEALGQGIASDVLITELQLING